MFHQLDRFRFPSPKGVSGTQGHGVQISRFGSMPPAAEFFDRYLVREWLMSKNSDALAFIDVLDPATTAEANPGTEWTNTQSGTSVITYTDGGFPAFIRYQTGAVDTNSTQAQNVRGSTATSRLPFDFVNARNFAFSGTFRISDANNGANTMEQMQFFFGIAPSDTSILAGVDDFIGFTKADGSGLLKISADQTSAVPTTAASSNVTVANLSTTGSNPRSLANKWFTLTMLGIGLDRTAQKGMIYGFLDQHSQPAGSSEFAPTHIGTLDLSTLSDVPGANGALSFAFATGEAVAKNLDLASMMYAIEYRLGV